MPFVLPRLGEGLVREVVGAVVEIVRVAVDGDAHLLAFPGADRRLQVVDEVVEVDLLLDPVGHLRHEPLAAHVAFERRAHLKDVEVDGAGRDRLLQARIVVGLGEVDPADLGAGIGLPGLQEATEEKIMEVLVVEPHEGQLNALELAFGHVCFGRAETHLADFLPIGIRRGAFADAGYLHDRFAQSDFIRRHVGGSRFRKRSEHAG